MTNQYFDPAGLYGGGKSKRGPFDDLLELNPQATFSSHLSDQGFNRSQSDALRNQFGRVQNDFLSQQYGMIRKGQAPTLRFDDFLGNADWGKLYNSLTPFQKGKSNNRGTLPA